MIKLVYIINLLSFAIMGFDKYSAIKNRWRISENILFLFTLLGGSLGILLGMIIFRHKTKKLRFKILVPIFVIIQIILSITFM